MLSPGLVGGCKAAARDAAASPLIGQRRYDAVAQVPGSRK